jgi:hypothetical protein
MEAANFLNKFGWFQTNQTKSAAKRKSDFDFWTIASHFEGAKKVASLVQMLLTCYSLMGDVERCQKVTSRHRTKYSNRKLDDHYCIL